MREKRKRRSFRRSYREYHLWVGLVGRKEPQHNPIVIAAFGQTRKQVADILREIADQRDINEKCLQKVTVTEGWGKATKATQITLRPDAFEIK